MLGKWSVPPLRCNSLKEYGREKKTLLLIDSIEGGSDRKLVSERGYEKGETGSWNSYLFFLRGRKLKSGSPDGEEENEDG